MTNSTLDYNSLNAMLNLYDKDGNIQFDKDKEAARQYFLQHVNQNTVFFHSLEEKIKHLLNEDYYDPKVIEQYFFEDVKALFKQAYAHKFRFETFLGAYKFYTQYALKTFDGTRYLERFEDRVVMTALGLAEGDKLLASKYIEEIISGRFQPATPTFLNLGKAQRGELVSCFLLRIEDNMESIARSINSSLQLSKRGGGVALLLSNIRESGAPIKKVEGQSSGIIPVMKLLEDSFSYANQLGSRQGAGAVYLNAHHPDIMAFLDTKRENADEKVRIKTLSLGVVVPDITFELAKRNEDMYLFSPYDVERVYGVPFSDISVTEKYYEMVDNPQISKKKINARHFFQTVAELQFESGYPYMMFEDTVNTANPIKGKINMSNLCVSGDTPILTDVGYHSIQSLVGSRVNVWNGEEFSEVQVEQTGADQELYRVTLSNGMTLDATDYHKFYVQDGYASSRSADSRVVEKRTATLKPGDRLIKHDLPVIETNRLDSGYHMYTNGFFTADGTYGGQNKDQPKIYLYGEKKKLLSHLNVKSGSGVADSTGRLSFLLHSSDTLPKYTVPTAEGSLRDRLDWFAGFLDGDGSGHSKIGVQAASNKKEFLQEILLMLQTLGVHSKIVPGNTGGMKVFREGQKAYPTKDVYRIVISPSETQKLVALGLRTHRLRLKPVKLNRSAIQHVKVVSVEKIEGVHDTFCFTEKKRGMGMFNGVLTGNCSEILQVNTPSVYTDDLGYEVVGKDISCNLGSLNIAKVMDGGSITRSVDLAIRALTSVAEQSAINSVPSIKEGNDKSHAIGLGQMNLHGYLAREGIHYGSEDALVFTEVYFRTVLFHALSASNEIAMERGEVFEGFDDSKYADGSFFKEFVETEWFIPKGRIRDIFLETELVYEVPTRSDWEALRASVMEYGLYNQNLQAIPPTGSISYINNSTSSIHPIASPIEIRKEGKLGRVYYPAPYMTNENREFYKDAYEIGYEAVIDTYAIATKYVDQGLSLTLFFKDTATTRDINKAQIYAWTKGIKTLYYIRIRQMALEGTNVDECVSCML